MVRVTASVTACVLATYAHPVSKSRAAKRSRCASHSSQSSPKHSPAPSVVSVPLGAARRTSPSSTTCIAGGIPDPAIAVPGRYAAEPLHSALSSSSLLSAGTNRNVSTMFSTFVHSCRARCTRVRTMRLNVSPLTANARVATGSISPFSETTRAVVVYACASATSPNSDPRLMTFPGVSTPLPLR